MGHFLMDEHGTIGSGSYGPFGFTHRSLLADQSLHRPISSRVLQTEMPPGRWVPGAVSSTIWWPPPPHPDRASNVPNSKACFFMYFLLPFVKPLISRRHILKLAMQEVRQLGIRRSIQLVIGVLVGFLVPAITHFLEPQLGQDFG